jgi:hypothetical protein
MVAWPEGNLERFDHGRTGTSLEGEHAKTECRSCHKPAFQRAPVASRIRLKDRTKSWLGLETACTSCHEDPHRASLGAQCLSCHDQNRWKPATGFDHARSRFPLTGKHADVACAECHRPKVAEAAETAVFRPLAHAECSSCHMDPHAGRFGGSCGGCHSTEGFGVLRAGSFDHDRTRYPLRGRHAGLACGKCHDPKTAGGEKPPFGSCGACHADAHAGKARVRGRVADCEACHSVAGFRPSTFDVEQHRETAYPLTGRHTKAECAGCHPRKPPGMAAVSTLGTARVVLTPAFERCTPCHRDPHGGRFAPGGARARKEDCLACHSTDAFRPSRFDAAAHETTPFPLLAAHRATPCLACHRSLDRKPPVTRAASTRGEPLDLFFDDAPGRCGSCHENPHGDQFARRRGDGDCASCHDVEKFSPATRFDHERDASFRLEGAHRTTACNACHRLEAGPKGERRVIYRPTPRECAACHGPGTPPSTKGAQRGRFPY